MAKRVSTEGCKVKWKQRNRSTTAKHHDSDSDDPIDQVLKAMDASIKTRQDVFYDRPNDDGVVNRISSQRKRRKQIPAGSSRRVQEANTSMEIPRQPMIDNEVHVHSSEDAHDDLNKFMDELLTDGDFEVSEWVARKQTMAINWDWYRFPIWKCLMEANDVPATDTVCHQCEDAVAIVKCLDCLGSLLCQNCDKSNHSIQPLHDRQTWKNGTFENLPQDYYFPTTKHFTLKQCNFCPSKELQFVDDGQYIVVTVKGRFDVPKYKSVCCGCQKGNVGFDLVNLLQRGFIPGDPDLKSKFIFEQRLLELWTGVAMNLPGSSLSGFISSLGDISEKYGRKRYIDHTLFARAAAEFNLIKDSFLLLKRQDNMKCPPCSIKQTMCHVDGNHKVYRFNHVDSDGIDKAYHLGRFIVSDELVEAHLQKVYSSIPSTGSSAGVYCGSTKWKAAKNAIRKKAHLDETGLVVAGCRHAIAQKAVNMKHGELYGYAHFLHVNFMLTSGVKFIWQDVICKYWPWAKKVAGVFPVWKDSVTNMYPALSVMHAKAHSWHCQIAWGGRYVEGSGAGSGEDMEQFFGHLSRTGNTTKHMGKAARIDTITNHVLFWNGRKIRHLPELLCKRYKRVKFDLVESENSPLIAAGKDLDSWKRDVVGKAKGATTLSSKKAKNVFFIQQKVGEANKLRTYLNQFSLGMSTVLGSSKLRELAACTITMAESLNQPGNTEDFEEEKEELIMSTIKSVQTEVEVVVQTYLQRQHDISNLAVSSKQRMKLRQRCAADKTKIIQLLNKLHEVELLIDTTKKKYVEKDILIGQFPWQHEASITWATKKRAVDAYMLNRRLHEEESLLIGEMKDMLTFYSKIYNGLKQDIKDLETEFQNSLIEEMESNSGDIEEDKVSPSFRYTLQDTSKTLSSIRGVQNIKRNGLKETKDRINHCLTCFRRVLSNGGWETMVLDTDDESSDEEEDIDDVDDFEDVDI